MLTGLIRFHLAFQACAPDQPSPRMMPSIIAGHLVAETVFGPGIGELHVALEPLGIFLARLGVDQDQGADDLWMGQRATKRQEPALAHPRQHRALDPEVGQQGGEVVGGVVVAERRQGVGRRAGVAALVPGDAAIAGPQRLDLRGEHLVVHEQAVREDHRRTGAAGVLVVDPLAVDLGDRHGRFLIGSSPSRSEGRWRVMSRAKARRNAPEGRCPRTSLFPRRRSPHRRTSPLAGLVRDTSPRQRGEEHPQATASTALGTSAGFSAMTMWPASGTLTSVEPAMADWKAGP